MTDTKNLMAEISGVLAEFDAKRLASLIASLDIRRAAVAAVDRASFSGPYASTQYASARVAAAGGKVWAEYLRAGNAWAAERITKLEAAKAEGRNAKIAAQLDKAGVAKVTGHDSTYTGNGFEGRWTVETDTGRRSVFISVILAGGYNIQCLHVRVLCRVV